MTDRPARLTIAAACLALLLPTCRSSQPSASGEAEVAAEIGGETITTQEIDQRIKDELFASRTGSPSKLYELRSEMLEEMIGDRVLEVEAKKRGVPASAVLELELKDMGPIPDEEPNLSRADYDRLKAEYEAEAAAEAEAYDDSDWPG